MTFNPVRILSQYKRGWSRGKRRQGVILDSELPAFYSAVQQLKNQTAKDYLLFLVLTGLRLNEAAGLRWSEVDLANGCLTLPPERTKNKQPHALPLTDYLLAMLKRRQLQNLEVGSPFVFPGTSRGKTGHYVEPKAAYRAVSDKMKKKFSAHDLRRTFITAAERLKIEHYALKRLLNHSNNSDVSGGYIITTLDRLSEPMNQINAYLLDHMQAPMPAPNNNVTPLERKRTARK